MLVGDCLGCWSLLGDVRWATFAWVLDCILLGDGFFEQVAWGCCFQDPICLGTLILATVLLGDLLGVGLLGAVIQGCFNDIIFTMAEKKIEIYYIKFSRTVKF